jgi:hypothetical protein
MHCGEFIGFVNFSLRIGAARRVANKVSVRCVGGLYVRNPSSVGGVSSLVTFRLSLSFQTIEVSLNLLCTVCAFGVRFVYVWPVSGVGSIIESGVIIGLAVLFVFVVGWC